MHLTPNIVRPRHHQEASMIYDPCSIILFQNQISQPLPYVTALLPRLRSGSQVGLQGSSASTQGEPTFFSEFGVYDNSQVLITGLIYFSHPNDSSVMLSQVRSLALESLELSIFSYYFL